MFKLLDICYTANWCKEHIWMLYQKNLGQYQDSQPNKKESKVIISNEFKSFLKTVGGNEGSKCIYNTRLDTYRLSVVNMIVHIVMQNPY